MLNSLNDEMHESGDRLVDAVDLRTFITELLNACGLPKPNAEIVADNLVDAHLRGIDTHGIVHLPKYVDRILDGGINPDPDIVVEEPCASIGIIQGDNGAGQVTTQRAIDTAINIAERTGGGFVGVRNSNHFGTASYYTNQAAERGYASICMTHAAPSVVPYGGTTDGAACVIQIEA